MASIPFKRYGIYWVDLDPTRGNELKKTRPAVIVSRDFVGLVDGHHSGGARKLRQ